MQYLIRNRIVSGLVVLVVVAAGCSSSADDASSDTSAAASTPAETSTSSSTSSTTTTTSSTTTTTLAPGAEVTDEMCATFTNAGFESRRAQRAELDTVYRQAGGEGDARAAAGAVCGDALDQLDGALAILDRMSAFDIARDAGDPPIELSDFVCGEADFTFTARNVSDTPLGLHVAFKYFLDAGDDPVQSSYSPIVIWALAPGASETVAGGFTGFVGPDVRCELEGQVFDADPSAFDASLGVVTRPELTGDDPSEWFPALFDAELVAQQSGDTDLAAVTEDVRSSSYGDVVDNIVDPPALAETGSIEICERGRSQPGPDRIGFVYLRDVPEQTVDGPDGPEVIPGGSSLRHGIFRRGADGQWRWLSTAKYFESALLDGCAGVGLDPSEFGERLDDAEQDSP